MLTPKNLPAGRNARREYSVYFNNLTVRELYASMPDVDDVSALFRFGIRIANDRMAVSAMEDLIRRKAYHDIIDVIDEAFEEGDSLVQGSSLVSLMMRSLAESTKGNETYLGAYARAVLGGQFVGPSAWLRENPEKWRLHSRVKFGSGEIDRLSGGAMVLPGNDR